MTKLSWDSRSYETGLDRGVLYLADNSGIAWNGLISVNETSAGFETSSNYIDGYKYALYQTPDSFGATLQAFTYPDEFEEYDGIADEVYTSQIRKPFNFSYRTLLDGDHYKIHLVYGAVTQPSEKANVSMGADMNPTAFSWDIVADAHYVINSVETYETTLQAIEDILYGSDAYASHLPPIEDIIDLFETNTTLRITDNGDGTYTAAGPNTVVTVDSTDPTLFTIDAPSIIFLDAYNQEFRISSY